MLNCRSTEVPSDKQLCAAAILLTQRTLLDETTITHGLKRVVKAGAELDCLHRTTLTNVVVSISVRNVSVLAYPFTLRCLALIGTDVVGHRSDNCCDGDGEE